MFDPNTQPPDDPELARLLADLMQRARRADIGQRRAAFEELYELALGVGPRIAAAIPLLVAGLGEADEKIGESASWALKYCASLAVAPLAECLVAPQASLRERAAHALGNIGDDALSAAPALRRLLTDEDQDVRRRAAWALGLMHDPDPVTLEALIDLALRGSSVDKAAALHAMGNIGKSVDGVLRWSKHRTLISDGLVDPVEDVRRWTLYALESCDIGAEAEGSLLASLLEYDKSTAIVKAALSRLSALAAFIDLAPHVSLLIRILVRHGPEASLVCEVLAASRPVLHEAVQPLTDALQVDHLVIPAAQALWAIEGERCAPLILPALDRVFEADDERVCDVVCQLGPIAAPLLPKLINALSGDNWDLQWAAADALAAVASSDPATLDALLEAGAHASPLVRSAAGKALARIGAPAVPRLRAFVDRAIDARSTWAAIALGEMGPAGADALPELRAGMRSSAQPLSGCCAFAVANIATDPVVIPLLMETLQSSDPRVPRSLAARALGAFGPAAQGAIAALEAAALEGDPGLLEAAEEALASIQVSRQ